MRLSNQVIQEDPSLARLNEAKTKPHDPRLNNIKEKIKRHMLTKDYDLEVIFKYLDKDKSKGVDLKELTNGLDFLNAEECRILFEAIDKDRSGEITYNEVVTECSKINC